MSVPENEFRFNILKIRFPRCNWRCRLMKKWFNDQGSIMKGSVTTWSLWIVITVLTLDGCNSSTEPESKQIRLTVGSTFTYESVGIDSNANVTYRDTSVWTVAEMGLTYEG